MRRHRVALSLIVIFTFTAALAAHSHSPKGSSSWKSSVQFDTRPLKPLLIARPVGAKAAPAISTVATVRTNAPAPPAPAITTSTTAPLASSPPVMPTTSPAVTTTTAPVASSGDPWAKVAWCEEGGTSRYLSVGPWFYSGPEYPDSIGINATNWYGNGGTSDVSEAAQDRVGDAVLARYGGSVPDQGATVGGSSRSGCAAW
jgi:hypothetical protein